MGQMHRLLAVLASAVALVTVASCSSGGPAPDAPEPVTEAVATAEPTPSAEEAPAATVEQWASVVAVELERVGEAHADWEDAICSSLTVDGGAVDCLTLQTVRALVADTTRINVDGAADPDGPRYLGAPPAEVEALVADLRAAAAAASAAGKEASDACPGEDCLRAAFGFEMAFGDLREALTAWSPYL